MDYQRVIKGLSEGYQRVIRGLSEGYQRPALLALLTPDDPSFIYVLGSFVLKVLYLSRHFIGPCESV